MKGLIFSACALISAPAGAQHVYKCVNWQGSVTYQSDRCQQGWRQDGVYSPTHVELDGRAVRNFVASSGSSPDALAPAYGHTMDASGRVKSDSACEAVRSVVNNHRGPRNYASLQSSGQLVSDLCNHSRGPGR